MNHNLTVLPDGKVLCTGGNTEGFFGGTIQYTAEIWDPPPAPGTGQWTEQPAMTDPRWYHSVAVLLPDARVFTTGGNLSGIYQTNSGQFFRPSYLNGVVPSQQIQVLTWPSFMQYQQQYVLSCWMPTGVTVAKVCLIRLASVTHGFDQDQRRVPLTIINQNPLNGQVTVSAPGGAQHAPPGYYMLFTMDTTGAPGFVARYVRVGF